MGTERPIKDSNLNISSLNFAHLKLGSAHFQIKPNKSSKIGLEIEYDVIRAKDTYAAKQ